MAASAVYVPQALHREEFATRMVTAGQNGNGGDIYQCADGLIGVVQGMKPYVTGDLITLRLVDAYDVPCATGTPFADGADVFWNSTTKLAVASPVSPGFYLGTARGAKANGAAVVRTLINGGGVVLNTSTLVFSGATGANIIQSPNNLAAGVVIKDVAGNSYVTVGTTTSGGLVTMGVPLNLLTGTLAASGTVAGGAQIVSQVTTVTAGDGTKAVKLPAPAVFGSVVIINTVAGKSLPIQSNNGETIDGGATLTILGGQRVTLYSDGTNWYSTVSDRGLTPYTLVSASQTVTQAGATALTSLINIVGTSAAAGAVKLPAPAPGEKVVVVNATGQTITVFGNATESINGTAGATGVALTTGLSITLYSNGTNWYGQAAS
jgi:hypothetical protein